MSKAKFYVTAKMLKDKNACIFQQGLFRTTFGKRAEVTSENVQKALEVGLQIDWLAYWLSSDSPDIKTWRRSRNIDRALNRIRYEANAENPRPMEERVAEALRLLNETGRLWAKHKAARAAAKQQAANPA